MYFLSNTTATWLQWYNSAANSCEHRQVPVLPILTWRVKYAENVLIQNIHLQPHLMGACTNIQARKRAEHTLYEYTTSRATGVTERHDYIFLYPLTPVQMLFSVCHPHPSMKKHWMSEAVQTMACAWVHRVWTMYQQVKASQEFEINILVDNILSIIPDRGLGDRPLACNDN